MVYCGKPSRGCQMCRTRRIKCDEGKPTCAQCQKSRRVCPGYKDDFDLVFRNETQATEKRAKKSTNKSKKVGSELVPLKKPTEPLGQRPPVASSSRLTYVPATLSFPVEQVATFFFFANFVSEPQNGGSKGFLDYMIPLANSEQSDKHLALAFSATTLAALGNQPNGKALLMKAQEQYNRAIRHVNEALRNPAEQKSDQTLAAVLLLGLFESILSRRAAIAAWGSHIDGAVMLVKMRGKKQLRTKLGNALFVAVRSQMIINSLSTGKKPQASIDSWMINSDGRGDDMDDMVHRLAMEVVELRHDVNGLMTFTAHSPENTNLVLDAMRRAHDLDQGFRNWMDQLPEFWREKVVAWADSVSGEDLVKSEVYPGKILVYSDIWIAGVWGMVRAARMFISGAVVRCTAWLHYPVDYRTTPEYAWAARLGVDMVNDTVASTAYHLGWTANEDFVGGNSPGSPRALGAYVWVWPLVSVYCSDYTTDAQRVWVKGRLDYMTDVMGINQAKTLSGYQLRLPSMTVKRDMMCALGIPPPNLAAALSNASSSPPYPTNAIPPSLTYSPSTTTPYVAASSSPPLYPATYAPSNASVSTYVPPNAPASAYVPPNYAMSSYPAPTCAMSNTAPSTTTVPYHFFPRQPSPPDEELLAAFMENEQKQRAQWEAETRRRELEKKKDELIDAATGGDSYLSELLERYMAVGMFDN